MYTSLDLEARMKISAMTCAVWVLACVAVKPAFASSCDGLAALALKDTIITMAQLVPAGQFSGVRIESELEPVRTQR